MLQSFFRALPLLIAPFSFFYLVSFPFPFHFSFSLSVDDIYLKVGQSCSNLRVFVEQTERLDHAQGLQNSIIRNIFLVQTLNGNRFEACKSGGDGYEMTVCDSKPTQEADICPDSAKRSRTLHRIILICNRLPGLVGLKDKSF